MNWKAIFKTLAATAIGGGVGAAAQTVTNRMQYGIASPPLTAKVVGISAGVGAATALVAYVFKSPWLNGGSATPEAPANAPTE